MKRNEKEKLKIMLNGLTCKVKVVYQTKKMVCSADLEIKIICGDAGRPNGYTDYGYSPIMTKKFKHPSWQEVEKELWEFLTDHCKALQEHAAAHRSLRLQQPTDLWLDTSST